MQPHKRTQNYLARLAICASLMTASLAFAQTPPPDEPKSETPKTPEPAVTETPSAKPAEATEQKVPTKAEVTAAGKAAEADDAPLKAEGETLVLSPFEVTTQKDVGYRGGQSMSGTRMGSDLDDIANPISVITKQQLLDFAARDINDIFASELGVEGTHTFTANFNDGKADVDQVSLNPETANRVRGLGAANISVGNYGKSSTIGIDTYNVDAVEISRGPNSSIFGMGEASGTVNLVPSSANLSRDFNKFSLSYSSYGTKRATVDLNRMLWKNVFALRVNALANNAGFLRKPSYDNTRRITISGTYHPFSYTTLRASFERVKQKYSRPNSVMPREYMTLWNQMGRPTWNAFTNQWSYNAYTNPFTGVSYPGGTGTINPSGNATTAQNQYYSASLGALWMGSMGSNRVRPIMAVNNSQVQWAGTQYWSAGTTNHELLEFRLPVNFNVPGEYQTSNYGALSYTPIKATNNKAFYDYENINLAGLNYGKKDADLWRVELEQFVVNTPMNVFAIQLGLFKERIEDYRRTFVGNGGDGVSYYILPDLNSTLPDGTVNPSYGAPYIGALAPQTYVNPIDTRTHRANVVYQLDLTKEKSWLKYLGKAKILGYAEEFFKTQVPKNLRYQDQISAVYQPFLPGLQPPTGVPSGSLRNRNEAKFLSRYYLGDGVGNNVDYGSSAPPINNSITFHRYGVQVPTAVPPAVQQPQLEPLGWYNLYNVPVTPQYFAMAQQNTQTTTRGMILQNYLVKDRIITTWGRRRDTLRTRDSLAEPASSLDPITGLTRSFRWMDDYGDWNVTNRRTMARMSEGYTDNKGIVVKPTKWLSLRYNQSTSFKPEDFAIDFQGVPLENSSGESKDYGFTLNLFKTKVYLTVTRFETFAKGSRDNAINTVGQRITNVDFDLDPNATGGGFDLEDFLKGEILNTQGLIEGTPPVGSPFVQASQAQIDAAISEAHVRMGLTDERIDLNRRYTRAMTADRSSKGYEVSLDINPTPYLSIKINGSKSETIYSNYGKTWQQYRDERMNVWKTIRGPYSGMEWWTQYLYSGKTPAQWWLELNEAPMKVNLALEGKPVPQFAKYRANTLVRYRLAGIFRSTPIVKDIAVGGKVSWVDKQALGFYGAEPSNVNGDVRVREYDASRPIWTRAKFYVDAFATYDFRLYKNRIKGNVQLNAKNVGESGRLQAFGVNPDGSKFNYRIIDPTEYILSLNFEL